MARILQIEDNNDIQKILRDFFSEEHEVIQAYSGTEGLRLFEAENIDLVPSSFRHYAAWKKR